MEQSFPFEVSLQQFTVGGRALDERLVGGEWHYAIEDTMARRTACCCDFMLEVYCDLQSCLY